LPQIAHCLIGVHIKQKLENSQILVGAIRTAQAAHPAGGFAWFVRYFERKTAEGEENPAVGAGLFW